VANPHGTPLAYVHGMGEWARKRTLLVVRSGGVGALATAFDLAVLAVLVSGAGIEARSASLPSLSAGILVQFVGNKLLAFRDHSPDWGRQLALFIGVEACGFACNLLLFHLAISWLPLPYLALRLVTTSVVYFGVCLPLWSRVFRAGALMEGRS